MLEFIHGNWQAISGTIFIVLEFVMRKNDKTVPPSKWVSTILDQFIPDNQKGLK
jgi:hypothetical protein